MLKEWQTLVESSVINDMELVNLAQKLWNMCNIFRSIISGITIQLAIFALVLDHFVFGMFGFFGLLAVWFLVVTIVCLVSLTILSPPLGFLKWKDSTCSINKYANYVAEQICSDENYEICGKLMFTVDSSVEGDFCLTSIFSPDLRTLSDQVFKVADKLGLKERFDR